MLVSKTILGKKLYGQSKVAVNEWLNAHNQNF